jgi:hypothetical protein
MPRLFASVLPLFPSVCPMYTCHFKVVLIQVNRPPARDAMMNTRSADL